MVKKLKWINEYYQKNRYQINEINLFGIRDSRDIEKDVINDYLGFFTKDEITIVKGTTETGVYWTLDKKERNKQGTFHLKEGFHEKIWCVGKHKGYEALVNDWRYCKPTRGWRDSNYNFVKDAKDIEVCDYFGINFHRMSNNILVKFIGRMSAGCQVVHDVKEFEMIMKKLKSTKMYLNTSEKTTFNYMLFNINEIPEGFLV